MAVSVDVEDCQGSAEVGTQLGPRQVAQLKQALTSQENNLEKKDRTNGQPMLLGIESVDVPSVEICKAFLFLRPYATLTQSYGFSVS